MAWNRRVLAHGITDFVAVLFWQVALNGVNTCRTCWEQGARLDSFTPVQFWVRAGSLGQNDVWRNDV